MEDPPPHHISTQSLNTSPRQASALLVMPDSLPTVLQEAVCEIFDRLGEREGVREVELRKLLVDPVAVEWMDSLTCFTLPVSL